jgi:hypothetical protein
VVARDPPDPRRVVIRDPHDPPSPAVPQPPAPSHDAQRHHGRRPPMNVLRSSWSPNPSTTKDALSPLKNISSPLKTANSPRDVHLSPLKDVHSPLKEHLSPRKAPNSSMNGGDPMRGAQKWLEDMRSWR